MDHDTTSPVSKRCIRCNIEKPSTVGYFHLDKSKPDGFRPYCKQCRQNDSSKLAEKDRQTWPENHKRCTHCHEVKPYSLFSPDSRATDGLFSWCKPCHSIHASQYNLTHKEERAAYSRKRRSQNVERMRAYSREYHAANRESRNAQSRKWREENRETVRETFRVWYKANREYVLNKHRQWSQNNRERIALYNRLNRPSQYASMLKIRAMHPERYLAYKHNRRSRILSIGGYFTPMDVANMIHIQQGHCCYCGRLGQKLTLEHIIPVTRNGSSNDPWNLALACKSCNSSKGSKLLSEWVYRWYL